MYFYAKTLGVNVWFSSFTNVGRILSYVWISSLFHAHTHPHTYAHFLHVTRRRKKIYNIAEEEEKDEKRENWSAAESVCSDVTTQILSAILPGSITKRRKTLRKKRKNAIKVVRKSFFCTFCCVNPFFLGSSKLSFWIRFESFGKI